MTLQRDFYHIPWSLKLVRETHCWLDVGHTQHQLYWNPAKCLFTNSNMLARKKCSLFFLPVLRLPSQVLASECGAWANKNLFSERTLWVIKLFEYETAPSQFTHACSFPSNPTQLPLCQALRTLYLRICHVILEKEEKTFFYFHSFSYWPNSLHRWPFPLTPCGCVCRMCLQGEGPFMAATEDKAESQPDTQATMKLSSYFLILLFKKC